eukprot:scaffold8394_cov85-Cylindrotheca_fusiformis.AAC.1
MDREPSNTAFPVGDASTLIHQYKAHANFIKQSESLATAAKPKTFTTDIACWKDWKPTFVGYLNLIPGVDGQPLGYVVRPDPAPAPRAGDLLSQYVAHAPLQGEAFNADNQTVYILLLSFMNENSEAESIIRTVSGDRQEGRAAYYALCEKYEGVGMLATDVIEAERIIENLFYSGERQPHMWWDRFERELKEAYAIVDRNAGRNVHEDDAKLRKLVNHRVTADFLKGAKDVLLVEMGKPNAGGMTFDMAMATFSERCECRNCKETKWCLRWKRKTGTNVSSEPSPIEYNQGTSGRWNDDRLPPRQALS